MSARLGLLAVVCLVAMACEPVSSPPTVLPSVAASTIAVLPTSEADSPPDASLAAEGGDPVIGQLGTYTWRGAGSDSPWLPGSAIAAGAGEPMIVQLAGQPRVGDWRARAMTADGAPGGPIRPLGRGSGAIGFAAPSEPGVWSVAVELTFADGSGSATYFWALDVR
jgi:hypothetical protein